MLKMEIKVTILFIIYSCEPLALRSPKVNIEVDPLSKTRLVSVEEGCEWEKDVMLRPICPGLTAGAWISMHNTRDFVFSRFPGPPLPSLWTSPVGSQHHQKRSGYCPVHGRSVLPGARRRVSSNSPLHPKAGCNSLPREGTLCCELVSLMQEPAAHSVLVEELWGLGGVLTVPSSPQDYNILEKLAVSVYLAKVLSLLWDISWKRFPFTSTSDVWDSPYNLTTMTLSPTACSIPIKTYLSWTNAPCLPNIPQ